MRYKATICILLGLSLSPVLEAHEGPRSPYIRIERLEDPLQCKLFLGEVAEAKVNQGVYKFVIDHPFDEARVWVGLRSDIQAQTSSINGRPVDPATPVIQLSVTDLERLLTYGYQRYYPFFRRHGLRVPKIYGLRYVRIPFEEETRIWPVLEMERVDYFMDEVLEDSSALTSFDYPKRIRLQKEQLRSLIDQLRRAHRIFLDEDHYPDDISVANIGYEILSPTKVEVIWVDPIEGPPTAPQSILFYNLRDMIAALEIRYVQNFGWNREPLQ